MAASSNQSRTDELALVYAQTFDDLAPNIEQAAYGSFATFNAIANAPGVKRFQSGGPRVQQAIILAAADRAEALGRGGTFDTTITDTKTAMLTTLRPYVSAWTLDQLDMDEVRPEQAIQNITEGEAKEAVDDLMRRLNRDMWLDGTANSERIIGFGAMVDDGPTTGTYLGISRANNANWRSQQRQNLTGDLALLADCNHLMTLCTYGNDKPNLIMATRGARNAFEAQLVYTLRTDAVANRKGDGSISGDPSVEDLFYRGARIVADDDAQGYGTDSSNLVFLNTKYLRLTVREGQDFKRFDMLRPVNQMVWTLPIRWSGAFWCSNLRYQGVVWDVATLV